MYLNWNCGHLQHRPHRDPQTPRLQGLHRLRHKHCLLLHHIHHLKEISVDTSLHHNWTSDSKLCSPSGGYSIQLWYHSTLLEGKGFILKVLYSSLLPSHRCCRAWSMNLGCILFTSAPLSSQLSSSSSSWIKQSRRFGLSPAWPSLLLYLQLSWQF